MPILSLSLVMKATDLDYGCCSVSYLSHTCRGQGRGCQDFGVLVSVCASTIKAPAATPKMMRA